MIYRGVLWVTFKAVTVELFEGWLKCKRWIRSKLSWEKMKEGFDITYKDMLDTPHMLCHPINYKKNKRNKNSLLKMPARLWLGFPLLSPCFNLRYYETGRALVRAIPTFNRVITVDNYRDRAWHLAIK